MNRLPFIRRRTNSGWALCIAVSERQLRIVAYADRGTYDPEQNRVTVWKVKVLNSGFEFEAPTLNDAEDYVRKLL